MSFLFSKEKRIVLSRRLKGFWQDFGHNKIGLLGLAIIIVYIILAIFGPALAQYHPSQDWNLASGWAAPEWITIFPEHRDDARTMYPSLDWVVGQSSELVNVTIGDGWKAEYHGNESTTIKIQATFNYPYEAPGKFGLDFEWNVTKVEATEYFFEAYLVHPFGPEYILWSSYQSESIMPSFAKGNRSRTPVHVRSNALSPNVLLRLGLSSPEGFSERVFIGKGDYSLMFNIRFKPTSEGTARISTTKVGLKTFGTVHGLLGTDNVGGDIWSQLVYGARVSLGVGLMSAVLATSMGLLVGIISGYSGGIVDELSMRIVDILLCLPVLPLLLGFFMLWGPNVLYLVILIAVFGWQGLSRLVRSQVLSLKEMPFIECARAAGASKFYIMLRHLLPNVLPVALASMVLSVPAAILTEAALSFIGFGDPLTPTWGRMLNEAFNYGGFRFLSWHWILPPGIALTALTLAFVFVGHAVDEIVNPKLRRRR